MSWIGRALQGAAEVAKPASLQQQRANIMAQRDRVLRQFAIEDRNAEQEFRRSEGKARDDAAMERTQAGIIGRAELAEDARDYDKDRYEMFEKNGVTWKRDKQTGEESVARDPANTRTGAAYRWGTNTSQIFVPDPDDPEKTVPAEMRLHQDGSAEYLIDGTTDWKPMTKQQMQQAMPQSGGSGAPQGVRPAPQGALDMLRENPDTKDQFKAKFGYLPEGFTTETGEPIAAPPQASADGRSASEIVDDLEGNERPSDAGSKRYGGGKEGLATAMKPLTEVGGIIGRQVKKAWDAGDEALMRNEYNVYKGRGTPVAQMPRKVIEWLAQGNGDDQEVAEARRVLGESQVANR